MLKGIKNAKIIEAKEEVLNEIFKHLQLEDQMNKTTMSMEFYYVFIDSKAYTMMEIGDLTGNSICTVRRHIRKFNDFIVYKKSK